MVVSKKCLKKNSYALMLFEIVIMVLYENKTVILLGSFELFMEIKERKHSSLNGINDVKGSHNLPTTSEFYCQFH